MTYEVVGPQRVGVAAGDLVRLGSVIGAANVTARASATQLLAAAEDGVSPTAFSYDDVNSQSSVVILGNPGRFPKDPSYTTFVDATPPWPTSSTVGRSVGGLRRW